MPNHQGELFMVLHSLFPETIRKTDGRTMKQFEFEEAYCQIAHKRFGNGPMIGKSLAPRISISSRLDCGPTHPAHRMKCRSAKRRSTLIGAGVDELWAGNRPGGIRHEQAV